RSNVHTTFCKSVHYCLSAVEYTLRKISNYVVNGIVNSLHCRGQDIVGSNVVLVAVYTNCPLALLLGSFDDTVTYTTSCVVHDVRTILVELERNRLTLCSVGERSSVLYEYPGIWVCEGNTCLETVLES